MFKPGFLKRLFSYFWPVEIQKVKGDCNHELEVLVYHGKLMLDTKNVNYSFGKLHEVMDGVLGKLKNKGYAFDQVLILGYGGGSAAKIIHEKIDESSHIIGVESDSKVIELTEKYFYRNGVKLIHEDAFHYVERAAKNEWQYDMVIIDLFLDENQPDYPSIFWAQIHQISNSTGAVVLNTMLSEKEFNALGKQIRDHGFVIQSWNEIPENRVWVMKKR